MNNRSILSVAYLRFLRALNIYITAPDGCYRENDLNDGTYDDQERNSHHGFLLFSEFCILIFTQEIAICIAEKVTFRIQSYQFGPSEHVVVHGYR